MALTGPAIKQLIQNSDNVNDFCDKLAQAIINNIEVKIPAGSVVISATGAVMNPTPIDCDVE